jgi:hypothetical protein
LNRTPKRLTTRVFMAALIAVIAGQAVSRADVVQSTVTLPPPNGFYTFGPFCLSNPLIGLSRCVEHTIVSDFVKTSDTEVSGNEVVDATASYSADVYTDNHGTPGTFVGDLSMDGTIGITYVGRNPAMNPLGTFTTLVTSFDFSGKLNGNTVEFIQNPSIPSTGSTTILETTFSPPIEYTVSSSVDLNGEYNFNGTGFMPAPTRTGTLTAIPEPGLGALTASILIVLGIASRRFRIR